MQCSWDGCQEFIQPTSSVIQAHLTQAHFVSQDCSNNLLSLTGVWRTMPGEAHEGGVSLLLDFIPSEAIASDYGRINPWSSCTIVSSYVANYFILFPYRFGFVSAQQSVKCSYTPGPVTFPAKSIKCRGQYLACIEEVIGLETSANILLYPSCTHPGFVQKSHRFPTCEMLGTVNCAVGADTFLFHLSLLILLLYEHL